MATPQSADHSQARATIIAAVITVIGAVAVALIGREWGERRAEQNTSSLEARLEQQEHALQSLEAQLAARDATITSLTERLKQSRTSSTSVASPDLQLQPSSGEFAKPDLSETSSEESTATASTPDSSASRPTQVERFAPFNVELEGCDHMGGVLACKFVIENTGDSPANLALRSTSTFAYSKGGSETRVRDARLGSQHWSGDKFGAVHFEPRLPLAAVLTFPGFPSDARTGTVKIVLGIAQRLTTATIFSEPEWQSLVFRDVAFR